MSPSIIQASTGPDPQMFIPRKPDQYQPLTNDDLRTDLLHIQEKYNVHDHGPGGSLRFATKVVAAADSLDHTAADYDYLCSGTGDQATINSALSAASAGGMVLLMEGNYDIASGVTLSHANQSLVGMGAGTKLNMTGTWSINTAAVISVAPRSYIARLAVDSSGTSSFTQDSIITSGDYALVDSVWLYGGLNPRINLGTPGDLVTNSHILGGGSLGGGIWLTADTQAVGNSLINCPITAKNVTRLLIAGNKLRWTSTTVGTAPALFLDNSEYCEVTGNLVALCPYEGILIQSGASDNLIQGNLVYGAGRNTNNTFDGIRVTSAGVACVDNYFVANKVRQSGLGGNEARYGFNISDAASATNLVVNNDFKNSGVTATFNDAGTGTVLNLDGSANNWNRLV